MKLRRLSTVWVFLTALFSISSAQRMETAGLSSAAIQEPLVNLQFENLPPASPAATDMRLTTNTSPQNETAIAVDPSNALNIIGGMNDYSLLGTGFGGNGVVYSTTGGASWTHLGGLGGGVPQPAGFTNAGGDPGIAFNSLGRAYYTFIAAAAGATTFTRNNGVFVSTSTSSGATWTTPVGIATNIWPGSGTVNFEDKIFCASDEWSTSPFVNLGYASWTRFYAGAHPQGSTGGGNIMFSRSTDNGVTWSGPIVVSSATNEPLNTGTGTAGSSFVQGSEPEVEKDGDVYVVYWFGGRINVSRSTDGGITFGVATYPFGSSFGVASIASPQPSETFRVNAYPNIETDPTRPGYVYVVGVDATASALGAGRDAGGDIIFARSTNNGATWGSTVILNNDAAGNNQVFPWMAVSNNGSINVIWYDTRNDAVGPIKDLDVYSTTSTDGGATWAANVRVTDIAFDPNTGSPFSGAVFFGDYNGLAASPNLTFHALWTDNRNGEQEAYYDFNNDPLPIQLANFTAVATPQNHVQLEWITLTETNNYGFEIEKSQNTPNTYHVIPNSFIPGHGTTLEPQRYSYTDATATPGRWWYRLKQIDLDGTINYTEGVQVDLLTGIAEGSHPIRTALMQNYPNPFNPSTTISFSLASQSDVTLELFDLLGQSLGVIQRGTMSAGNHSVSFDALNLSSGVYIYRMTAGNFVEAKKLVVSK